MKSAAIALLIATLLFSGINALHGDTSPPRHDDVATIFYSGGNYSSSSNNDYYVPYFYNYGYGYGPRYFSSWGGYPYDYHKGWGPNPGGVIPGGKYYYWR